ncbi:MAG TPA: hypothetical protein VIU38_07145 [Anaerolineales bacterium]
MAGPIVFISRNKIKPGRAAEFREHYAASVPVTAAQKPQTVAQVCYESDDSTEVTVVRLFHDADGLDLQLQAAEDRSKKTYEFIEPVGIEIFGEPNPATVERMKQIAGSGIRVEIHPAYVGGFIR